MENKKYLNEEEYLKNAKKLKNIGKIALIIGIITLVLGVVLTVLGFANFGNAATDGFGSFTDNPSGFVDNSSGFVSGIFGSMGLFALGSFMDFLGFAITAAGAIIMFIAHRREIAAFSTQQIMPVAKEGAEAIAPTLGTVAKEISKGIKEGMQDDTSDK